MNYAYAMFLARTEYDANVNIRLTFTICTKSLISMCSFYIIEPLITLGCSTEMKMLNDNTLHGSMNLISGMLPKVVIMTQKI